MTNHRLTIQLFNEGLILSPDTTYLNQYPLDIYVNLPTNLRTLTPQQLRAHPTLRPDHQEVRAGAAETTLNGLTYRQFFFLKNSPKGLDLSLIPDYDYLYRVTDARTTVLGYTDQNTPITLTMIPSSNCSCSSTLRGFQVWAGCPASAMERIRTDALPVTDAQAQRDEA